MISLFIVLVENLINSSILSTLFTPYVREKFISEREKSSLTQRSPILLSSSPTLAFHEITYGCRLTLFSASQPACLSVCLSSAHQIIYIFKSYQNIY